MLNCVLLHSKVQFLKRHVLDLIFFTKKVIKKAKNKKELLIPQMKAKNHGKRKLC